MFGPLRHPVYARLFAAQVVALIGTGLLTVALGLLAWDLSAGQAGVVLGTAYAIKMVAYVGLAPVAGAIAERLPRRAVLVGADLLRAGVALCLPFVDAVWQVYILIFLLQAASATFTPAFQATIPEILPDEGDYTRALSLSRLAYELESLASPALAGLLLLVIPYNALFLGTVAGFLASAGLVLSVTLPPVRSTARPFRERLTRGTALYLATPRLRGLLALTFTVAGTSAFVIVNTVVVAKQTLGGGDGTLTALLAAYGFGAMMAAMAMPALLDRTTDRAVMVPAASALSVVALLGGLWFALGQPGLAPALALWAILGLLYSAVVTPSARLLRRSAAPADRPGVFTAHFALSHGCWLLTYPLAGWIGASTGLAAALMAFGLLGALAALLATRLWPAEDDLPVPHDHPDLPPDHPHLARHGTGPHRHPPVTDEMHPMWPTRA